MKTKKQDHHQNRSNDDNVSLQNHKHTPVLLEETLQYLSPKKGDKLLDVTAGYGGHSKAILERTLTDENSALIDQDQSSIDYLKKEFEGREVAIIKGDYLNISKELLSQNKAFDMILADIGVSSEHLDNKTRGFSFQADGPLDMRMNQDQELTAGKIINRYSKKELVDILQKFGEEYKAHSVADQIISSRPIVGTGQLAKVVARAFPNKKASDKHVATKTFQALRIAVNNELEQLEKALPVWIDLLNGGGRLAVISFHSLEDRIVKRYFAKESEGKYTANIQLLTSKPVTASKNELVLNPRARSAKLRAVAKIKK